MAEVRRLNRAPPYWPARPGADDDKLGRYLWPGDRPIMPELPTLSGASASAGGSGSGARIMMSEQSRSVAGLVGALALALDE